MKIGIIGAGAFGRHYIRIFHELEGAEVAVVCDTDLAKLEWVEQAYPDVRTAGVLQQVLVDTDVKAVVIATPSSTHAEIARTCLRAGKNLLLEKPMTLSATEAEELREVEMEKDLMILVGHTYLYNQAIHRLKEALPPGLKYLHARRTNEGPVREDVPVLWDLAPHDVAIFLFLLDRKPLWVSATGTREVAFITLCFEENLLANIFVSWLAGPKIRQVEAVGTETKVIFDDMQECKLRRITSGYEFWEGRISEEPLKAQCKDFLEALRGDKRPLSDSQIGLDVVRILEAAQASMRNGGEAVWL